MYILNIHSAIERSQSKNSKTFYSKTIMEKFDLKKKLLLLAIKLIEKYLMLGMLKNNINHF